MKRSLTRAALGPNRLRLAGAIQVIPCVIGVNAVSALSQRFNQIAADAIADCIGGQILQSMPVPSATFKECLLERINRSKPMIRLIAVAFVLIVSTSAQAAPLAPLQQPDGMTRKSAKHAVPVCTWSMVPACVPRPAGTPPGAQLGCVQWVAVALNEMPRLAKSKEVKTRKCECVTSP